MKKILIWGGMAMGGILLLLLGLNSCIPEREKRIATAKTPRPGITLTRITYISGPMAGDDNYLYADMVWNGKSDRQQILYHNYLAIGKITWVRPDKMVICLLPDELKALDEFNGKVTLSAGGHTAVIYTELKGDCPESIWKEKSPL